MHELFCFLSGPSSLQARQILTGNFFSMYAYIRPAGETSTPGEDTADASNILTTDKQRITVQLQCGY